MKKILGLLILLTLSSCSSWKRNSNLPDWVNNSSESCVSNSLCAVGSGDNAEQARARAMANLAKIFENQISSEYKTILTGKGNDIAEESEDSIVEQTKLMLEGAEVKKTFFDERNHYALAEISKSKWATLIRKDIEVLDNKMKALLKEKSITSLVSLERLLKERAPLERKMQFLGAASFLPPISFESLAAEKVRRLEQIRINVRVNGVDKEDFTALLKEGLSQSGFSTTDGALATHLLNVTVKSQDAYLKVQGFVKKSYVIKCILKDLKGNELSTVVFDYAETGRSVDQIEAKVFSQFKIDINERINEFNIQ